MLNSSIAKISNDFRPFLHSQNFHHSTAVAACSGFAADRRAGRRHQSTAAGAQQQRRRSTALSSKCAGSVMLTVELTRLNTNLFCQVLCTNI